MAERKKSTEYSVGPTGIPVGPDLDTLSPDELIAIQGCIGFLKGSADRIKHFTQRVKDLGRSGSDTVITLIDVDDPTGNGALLAEYLMPGHNWQQYRDIGETPVARGIIDKDGFPEVLTHLGYSDAGNALANTDTLSVVALYASTVQIMEVQF